MRAAIATAYGPPEVVRIVDMPVPEPGPGQIRVRVHAASVSAGDWRLRSGDVPDGFNVPLRLAMGWKRLRQPVLGNDFSGIVDAVGAKVTAFRVGDAVFGSAGMRMGCHADYKILDETAALARKPDALSHVDAAAIPFGAQTALGYLRDKGKLRAGERVLIVGASGAVGSSAVQIARHLGAEVTAVTSARNAGLVRDLGASTVIAYDDPGQKADPGRYDMIIDTVGAAGYPAYRDRLAAGGRLLAIAAGLPEMLRAVRVNLAGRHKIVVGEAGESAILMRDTAAMVDAGAIRPLIDRVLPFAEIVEAHARVESRRKVGAVVVVMTDEADTVVRL